MGNKRIYQLTDEQTSYDENIQVAVSDSSFTSGDKKMKLINIYKKIFKLDSLGDYNPTTTLLRVDTGSGAERKVTVKDLLEDSDTVTLLKTALGLTDTGWENGSKVYAGIIAGTFICRAIQVGDHVYFSGQLNTTAAPPIGSVMFTLPNSVGVCSEDWYFNGADDSAGNEYNAELKVAAGTRNVVTVSASVATGVEFVFGTSYPAI